MSNSAVSNSFAIHNYRDGFVIYGSNASLTNFTARDNWVGVRIEDADSLIGPVGLSCNNSFHHDALYGGGGSDFSFSEVANFTGEFTYDTVTGSYSGNPTQIPCES